MPKDLERNSTPYTVVQLTHFLQGQIATGNFAPQAKSLLRRLYQDHRMNAVWKALLRRKRNGAFFNAADATKLNPSFQVRRNLERRCRILKILGDPQSLSARRQLRERISAERKKGQASRDKIGSLSIEQRQELACGLLFHIVFSAAILAKGILTSRGLRTHEVFMDVYGLTMPSPLDFPSRFEFASEVVTALYAREAIGVLSDGDFRRAADYLESTADELDRAARLASLLLENRSIDVRQPVDALRRKARLILSLQGSRFHVKRNRGDGTLRLFVLRVDEFMRDTFGSSMYGTVATLANVALDREDLTLSKIRELVRDS